MLSSSVSFILPRVLSRHNINSYFADSHEECENCLETLSELENVDDDVERQKIKMAKTIDASFAEEVGVESFPALVFFKVT